MLKKLILSLYGNNAIAILTIQGNTTMTNIIQKIETKADNANKFLKENGADCVIAINEIMEKREELGNIKFKEFCLNSSWKWLYNKKSEKTGELVMSDVNKNIMSGMRAVYDNELLFADWCDSEHGNKVVSFAKMKSTLSAFSASKNKTEKTEAEQTEAEQTTAVDYYNEQEKNDKRTQAQLLENFLQIWKSAEYGDSIAFMEYLETKEAIAVADKYIQVA